MRGGGGGERIFFLAKLDLQNAYWSIRLPPLLRRFFVVKGGTGQRFRYAHLPFGWNYSLAICQHLVLAMIRRVLAKKGIRGWVYLDDILLCQAQEKKATINHCVAPLDRIPTVCRALQQWVATVCYSLVCHRQLTPWAVAPEGYGFQVGIVGGKAFYKSVCCPPWIESLQQAELFAVYVVAKLATYRGYASVRIGFDSYVPRSQINALRLLICSVSQQRIL